MLHASFIRFSYIVAVSFSEGRYKSTMIWTLIVRSQCQTITVQLANLSDEALIFLVYHVYCKSNYHTYIVIEKRTCILFEGRSYASCSWSYGSWIYNYLCNQCLSPLMLWVRISIRARCTTLCDKVYQWLATCQWFSQSPPVSSTNKTDRHDIAEILLKVALNTIKQTTNLFEG